MAGSFDLSRKNSIPPDTVFHPVNIRFPREGQVIFPYSPGQDRPIPGPQSDLLLYSPISCAGMYIDRNIFGGGDAYCCASKGT